MIGAEIDGVQSEFSSLPGIRESVIEIFLNLRELILSPIDSSTKGAKSTKPFTFAKLKSNLNIGSFPYVITAGDLDIGDYCLVDPNQPIATVLSKAAADNFKLTVFIGQGRSYQSWKKLPGVPQLMDQRFFEEFETFAKPIFIERGIEPSFDIMMKALKTNVIAGTNFNKKNFLNIVKAVIILPTTTKIIPKAEVNPAVFKAPFFCSSENWLVNFAKSLKAPTKSFAKGNNSCPISTPTLNAIKLVINWPWLSPISFKTDANPRPCRSPKLNTTNGLHLVVFLNRVFSTATQIIDKKTIKIEILKYGF